MVEQHYTGSRGCRQRMLISCVVPVFNEERFLAASMESVCSQSTPPSEVVVVDDCSSDNSPKIIADYVARYPFVRYVRYPEKAQCWLEALWTRILPTLTGQFIISHAADDIVQPGFFAAAAQAVKQWGGDPGCIFSDWQIVADDGSFSGLASSDLSATLDSQYMEGTTLANQLMKPRFFEGGHASLIRRDLLMQLHAARVWELGPWQDSMGWSVSAWRGGAVYLRGAYGYVTIKSGGGNYNDVCVGNVEKSLRQFAATQRFLAECADVPVEVRNALERKVFGRFSPKALAAWLSRQTLDDAKALAERGQWGIAAVIYGDRQATIPDQAFEERPLL